MTAGTAATVIIQDEPQTHSTDASLPFQPRRLTPAERSRRELFVYQSPRNNRVVTIAGILNLAIALRFEFDPSIVAYVERPRRIRLTPKQEIDLSFWTRDRTGQERYYLSVTNAGTMSSTSGTVSIRDRGVLDEAAARHDLQLSYVTEREITSDLGACAIAFELLPHVWAYRQLTSRTFIRHHILGHLTNNTTTTLEELFKVVEYPHDSIRAVVAAMVHDGTLRLVNYVAGNHAVTLEVRRA
mgnify:CR=1 FL=1|jgi:hypothetical protein